MYLTKTEFWYNSKGKTNTERYDVEFFESDQQAIEEFEKEIHQDMWVFSGYRSGAELVTNGPNQAKTIWRMNGNEYVFSIKIYTLTEEHPISFRLKGI